MGAHIAKDQHQFYKNQIRRLKIMDPKISGREAYELLQANGIKVGYVYVLKVMKMIAHENAHTRLNYTLTEYLQNFVNTLSELDRKLWMIVTSSDSTAGQKIYAASEIRKNRESVFERLFEAGVFEKQLGNLNLKTFMDIVKGVTEKPYADTTGTTLAGDPPVAQEPGGSDSGVVGKGLADLVRLAGDSAVGGGEQKDGGS